jgi:ketosteroid isomerase-like protein
MSSTTTTPAQATAQDIEAARGFLTALVNYDREAFAALAHDEIVFRDLNPHGLDAMTGRDDVVAVLAMFAENVGRTSLRQCDARAVGHRVQVTYAYSGVKDGVHSHFEVHAFCEVRDGRVVVVDEVCSGRITEVAS